MKKLSYLISGVDPTFKCYFALDKKYDLQCDVSTRSKNWDFVWKHNGKEIGNVGELNRVKHGGKLVITMREEFAGNYECSATSNNVVEITNYEVTKAVLDSEFRMHPEFKLQVNILIINPCLTLNFFEQ